ncbi:transcription factor grauzone-like [Anopheles marshallii]|uniref:transcription factor grauzone-like n=1 Tax=Anopheles marshallii TaxID=1521116 RepID=UPI00237AF9DE|nr:transcription factor grauzone-like [Anopheles marshallii]
MNEKCRLCLCGLPKGTGISITDEELQKELENIFCFDIVYEEQLPTHVCKTCRNSVSYIYSYSQKILENQQQLLDVANKTFLQPAQQMNIDALCDTVLSEEETLSKEKFWQKQVTFNVVQPTNLISAKNGGRRILESSDEHILVKDENQQDEPQQRRKVTVEKNVSGNAKKSRAKQCDYEKIIQDFFKLECEICSASLDSFRSVQDHYREEHNTNGYVRCCDKQYFIRSYLVDHIGAHLGSIRCEICQKSYKTKRYLQQHMSENHSHAEDKPFKCTQCRMTYSKEHLLRAHMQMHVKQQCKVCQKVLSNRNSLKVHIAQVHSGDGIQICATCGKMFRTKQAMDRHVKLYHQPQLVNWEQCGQCDKWFDCNQNLRKHIRLIHDQRGSFPCDKCTHQSITRRALSHHKNRIHKQKQPFECEQCGKKLNSKFSLREHLATHSNVPLYSCDFCEITFNSNANKYKHYKNKHLKEWEDLKQQKLMQKMATGIVST